MKMCKSMYVVRISHPQPRLDVLGVKRCSLPFSCSSVIGRKKIDEEVDLLRVVSPNQSRQQSTNLCKAQYDAAPLA